MGKHGFLRITVHPAPWVKKLIRVFLVLSVVQRVSPTAVTKVTIVPGGLTVTLAFLPRVAVANLTAASSSPSGFFSSNPFINNLPDYISSMKLPGVAFVFLDRL